MYTLRPFLREPQNKLEVSVTFDPPSSVNISGQESLPVRQPGGPTSLNNKWIFAALGLAAMSASAVAQRASGAENALVGIKLYDTGVRVVSVYGTPDAVQAVGGGGTAIGPGGGGAPAGGGRPGFGPGGPGGPAGPRGGGGGPAMSAPEAFHDPGSLGNQFLQMGAPSLAPAAPGQGGAPGGAPGPGMAPGGPPGGGGGVGNAGGSGRILFTRWVYNRNGSKYGFVLDKSNRVVQIEAIGLTNSRVKTSRGITFGSTFAQLIRKYNAPDGYEINGENVVVRFLVRNKVAFRLSRLGPNKPQVVTGIVVAAGKT